MRVLYVINGLGTGGAERSLAEMLPQLHDAGIVPVVVCLHQRSEGVEQDVRGQSFDVRFLRASSWAGRIRELRRIILQQRPDIVHTTIFEADVVGRIAAVNSGSAVVTSLVNTSYDPVRLRDPNVHALKLWAARQLDGWTARHLTDGFHAITSAVKESAVHNLRIRPELVSVVPRGRATARLGSPSEARRRAARLALGVEDTTELIVTVGRQEYQKGQDDLLRALALLARRRPNCLLLLAGRQGHATGQLEDLARSPALRDRVRFLGHRDDVPELLAAADVFAFPSHYEGAGGAVIEAMGVGTPIVATAIPALQELLDPGQNAVLVPPGRPDLLADALERLLSDPSLRQTLRQRSREAFLRDCTIERATAGLLSFYRHVTGESLAVVP